MYFLICTKQVLDVEKLEALYGYQVFEGNFILKKKVHRMTVLQAEGEAKGDDEEGYTRFIRFQHNQSTIAHGNERKPLSREVVRALLNDLTGRFVENEVDVFKGADCEKCDKEDTDSMCNCKVQVFL